MKLPRGLSGEQTIRALEKAGFRRVRQRGSHVVVKRADPPARTVVPLHRELDTGTLRGILADIELSVEAFLALL
ncbi:MAG: type II toxin-antitoxin system HicA family toxin [Candidatus Wallbacteria bacterium]|nr:type II toxin-antitoxin system HicA family toxin [Candidatus Wallbacteria bacterium]